MNMNFSLFKKPIQKFEHDELTDKFFSVIKEQHKHINKCLSFFGLSNIIISSLFIFSTMGKQTYEFFPIVMSCLIGSVIGLLLTVLLAHFAELGLNKTKTFKKMKAHEAQLIEELSIKLEDQTLQFSLLKTLEDHILQLKSFEFEDSAKEDTKTVYLKDLNSIKENLLLFFSEGNFKEAANYLLNYETISSIETSYEIYKKLDKQEYTMINDHMETNTNLKKYKALFAIYSEQNNNEKSELKEVEYEYKKYF